MKQLSNQGNINNYNLSNIKFENNKDISELFNYFINEIPNDRKNYKGEWKFQRFKNDKITSNYIKTYQNIKICIEENVQMDEIIKSLHKNKNIKNHDISEEKNLMSALIWKKFFKKKQKDNDEDKLFYDNMNDSWNYGMKNELFKKKRKGQDNTKNENEK